MRRGLVLGVPVVALIVLTGYAGYAGAAGSDDFLNPPRSEDCRTPAVQYGWSYEAVNYDGATDRQLVPRDTGTPGTPSWSCTRAGSNAGGSPIVPAGSEVVTPDGARIAGWYIPAASGVGPSGPTILVVHGRSSNKSEYLRHAPALHSAFNLLVIDLRNAGQSSAMVTTLGVREKLDVEAMVDWLERTKHPTWIGAVGTSLGAAAILGAAVTDDRLAALVLDSMHAEVVTLWGNAVEAIRHLPGQPAGWAIVTVAGLRAGVDIPSADPVRLIGRLGDRPVLLTHGARDDLDKPATSLEVNARVAIEAGVSVEVFVCPEAGHAAVVDECGAAWGDLTRDFFVRVVAAAR